MGLNICVYRRDHTEHPDWDWTRLAGDRDFAAMLGSLPCIREDWGSQPDIEPHYRPADFAAWRKAIAEHDWPNPGRFEGLIDLLERNPDCWIYVSY